MNIHRILATGLYFAEPTDYRPVVVRSFIPPMYHINVYQSGDFSLSCMDGWSVVTFVGPTYIAGGGSSRELKNSQAQNSSWRIR